MQLRRDQKKGSFHAKRNMSELRDRKARLAVIEASKAWCERHGVEYTSEWLNAAKQEGYPHATGLSHQQKKVWFDTH